MKSDAPITEAWSSGLLYAALRRRFPSPAYALLSEVRNQTGYSRTIRSADAVVMSLYPSRGLHLDGFEFKSNRGDWLREKDNPDKAEEIARFCDHWWLVVGHPRIVSAGELPPKWGLLVPGKKDTLTVAKAPESLAPQPVTREFLASLMRRLAEPPKGEAIEAVKSEAFRIGRERGEATARDTAMVRELAEARRDVGLLREAISEFEAGSGVKIRAWEGGHIGRAVRVVMENRVEEQLEQLRRLRATALLIAATIDRGIADGAS